MKYWPVRLLVLCCFFARYTAHAQIRFDKKGNPLPPGNLSPVSHYKCFRQHHYPLTKRLGKYPFNKAKKVTIISFKTAASVLLPADTLEQVNHYTYEYTSVPGKDSLSGSSITERITLNDRQVDRLTAILYNYDYRNMSAVPRPVYGSGCYAPHNAILFSDENDEVFAYIELCFTCDGIQKSDAAVDSGVPCLDKVNLLQSFFTANGITIGTTRIPVIPMPDLKLNSK